MAELIDPTDLVDAYVVAQMLGLAQRNTVSVYQKRYPEMPRPIVDMGRGRCRLWSRAEIAAWAVRNEIALTSA